MIGMRLYYRTIGGHVHCRLFVGQEGSGGKAGDLTFRVSEWDDVRFAFEAGGFSVRPEALEPTP